MSTSHAKRFCLGIAVMALTVTCSSVVTAANWPMFRHDNAHTGRAGEVVNSPLKMAWTAKLGEVIISSPAIVDGVVYVGSREKTLPSDKTPRQIGALNALDAKTGKLKWKYIGTDSDPVGWVDASPTVADGVIYFTSRDGHLYAIGTNGKLKWKFKSGGTEMSSPTVANGAVFFGSGYPNKDVFAVEAATGKLRWKFNTGQMIYSSAAVANGTVYIGSDDGKFYALDPETGKQKWNFDTKGGIFFFSPLVSDGMVYCAPGDYDPNISAVDAATGQLKWQFNTECSNNYVSSAAIQDGVLYIGSCMPEHKLYALDASSGKVKWKVVVGATTGQMFTSSPAISGKTIYIGAGPAKVGDPNGGKLLALDIATGKTKWEFKTDDPVISSPAVSNGMVYAGTTGGILYAFKQGSTTPARASRASKTTRKKR